MSSKRTSLINPFGFGSLNFKSKDKDKEKDNSNKDRDQSRDLAKKTLLNSAKHSQAESTLKRHNTEKLRVSSSKNITVNIPETESTSSLPLPKVRNQANRNSMDSSATSSSRKSLIPQDIRDTTPEHVPGKKYTLNKSQPSDPQQVVKQHKKQPSKSSEENQHQEQNQVLDPKPELEPELERMLPSYPSPDDIFSDDEDHLNRNPSVASSFYPAMNPFDPQPPSRQVSTTSSYYGPGDFSNAYSQAPQRTASVASSYYPPLGSAHQLNSSTGTIMSTRTSFYANPYSEDHPNVDLSSRRRKPPPNLGSLPVLPPLPTNIEIPKPQATPVALQSSEAAKERAESVISPPPGIKDRSETEITDSSETVASHTEPLRLDSSKSKQPVGMMILSQEEVLIRPMLDRQHGGNKNDSSVVSKNQLSSEKSNLNSVEPLKSPMSGDSEFGSFQAYTPGASTNEVVRKPVSSDNISAHSSHTKNESLNSADLQGDHEMKVILDGFGKKVANELIQKNKELELELNKSSSQEVQNNTDKNVDDTLTTLDNDQINSTLNSSTQQNSIMSSPPAHKMVSPTHNEHHRQFSLEDIEMIAASNKEVERVDSDLLNQLEAQHELEVVLRTHASMRKMSRSTRRTSANSPSSIGSGTPRRTKTNSFSFEGSGSPANSTGAKSPPGSFSTKNSRMSASPMISDLYAISKVKNEERSANFSHSKHSSLTSPILKTSEKNVSSPARNNLKVPFVSPALSSNSTSASSVDQFYDVHETRSAMSDTPNDDNDDDDGAGGTYWMHSDDEDDKSDTDSGYGADSPLRSDADRATLDNRGNLVDDEPNTGVVRSASMDETTDDTSDTDNCWMPSRTNNQLFDTGGKTWNKNKQALIGPRKLADDDEVETQPSGSAANTPKITTSLVSPTADDDFMFRNASGALKGPRKMRDDDDEESEDEGKVILDDEYTSGPSAPDLPLEKLETNVDIGNVSAKGHRLLDDEFDSSDLTNNSNENIPPGKLTRRVSFLTGEIQDIMPRNSKRRSLLDDEFDGELPSDNEVDGLDDQKNKPVSFQVGDEDDENDNPFAQSDDSESDVDSLDTPEEDDKLKELYGASSEEDADVSGMSGTNTEKTSFASNGLYINTNLDSERRLSIANPESSPAQNTSGENPSWLTTPVSPIKPFEGQGLVSPVSMQDNRNLIIANKSGDSSLDDEGDSTSVGLNFTAKPQYYNHFDNDDSDQGRHRKMVIVNGTSATASSKGSTNDLGSESHDHDDFTDALTDFPNTTAPTTSSPSSSPTVKQKGVPTYDRRESLITTS
ncbi:unnamed protein product [Ambrosiozyma monospora]|uniref:Unnamed protein product n=1 Tax=Ambrosiozyma monospora TaxID=43982 RepID=A0ACB5SZG3_AMBMO|nr:unnamed protein product [Ambrosiozyma monospora]